MPGSKPYVSPPATTAWKISQIASLSVSVARRMFGMICGPCADAHVGDPVALSARQAGFDVLAFEVGGAAAQARRVDIFQRVHVDHRVQASRDFAGHQRHGPAGRADVERGGPRSESVVRHPRAVANEDRKPGARVRRPHAAMLEAERTAAGARRNRGRIARPFQVERYVAAMALSADQHSTTGVAFCEETKI